VPRNDDEARAIARILWSAPGTPSSRIAIPDSQRGERSAGRRWGLRGPRWAVCETHPWDVLRASRSSLRSEERAFRRSTCGVLRCAGRAFENVDQPRLSASSWRQVVMPASGAPPSPGSPECVAPNPRRRISRWRDFPGHRPGGVRPHLRPCPHRCSVFTASHDDAPRGTGQDDNPPSGVCVNSPSERFCAALRQPFLLRSEAAKPRASKDL
jgi:hypothetical protein